MCILWHIKYKKVIVYFLFWNYSWVTEKGRKIQWERESVSESVRVERQSQRERQRDRKWEREREKDTDTEKVRNRHREKEKLRIRQKGTDGKRESGKEAQKPKEENISDLTYPKLWNLILDYLWALPFPVSRLTIYNLQGFDFINCLRPTSNFCDSKKLLKFGRRAQIGCKTV